MIKHKARGNKATIVVQVPSAGKLIANGKGIHRTSKRLKKNGGPTAITIHATRQIRENLKHHHHMNVQVHIAFKPKHGKTLHTKLKVHLR